MRGAKGKNLLYEKVRKRNPLDLRSKEIKNFMQTFLPRFKKSEERTLTAPGILQAYRFVIKETDEWVEYLPVIDFKTKGEKPENGEQIINSSVGAMQNGFYLFDKDDEEDYGFLIHGDRLLGMQTPDNEKEMEIGSWYSLVEDNYCPGKNRSRSRIYCLNKVGQDALIINAIRMNKKQFTKDVQEALDNGYPQISIEDKWVL